MTFIDSQTHIDFPEFDADRDSVIIRAQDVEISDIIVTATRAKRWPILAKTVSQYTQCHAAFGLHPMFIKEHQATHLEDLEYWLNTENAIAVGEIGLDFLIPEPQKEKQLEFFIAQLKIARKQDLPVVIHARKSLDSVLKQIRLLPGLRGSIHCFSGSAQQANQLIDLGFYLGFGGPVTYTRATRLRKLVAILPLEHLLLETDSPDQPDATHHGERNEPAYLPNVAHVIAELRGISLEEVANTTTLNAQALFRL